MIKDIENIKVYSKPQDIFKHLLNGEGGVILHSNKNNKLLKRLRCSENNSFYNPIKEA